MCFILHCNQQRFSVAACVKTQRILSIPGLEPSTCVLYLTHHFYLKSPQINLTTIGVWLSWLGHCDQKVMGLNPMLCSIVISPLGP